MFAPKWRMSPPIAQTGQLIVVSQPPGGDVIVDGQRRGVTPLTLSLKPGPHALQLNRAEISRSIAVTIKAGAETTHYVDLDAPRVPASGQLVVGSEPPGARVTVDGQARGATPVTLRDIAAGQHTVIIQGASGLVQRSVTVQRGQSASLLVSMTGKPRSVGFRFRHRSCCRSSRRIASSARAKQIVSCFQPVSIRCGYLTNGWVFRRHVWCTSQQGEAPRSRLISRTASSALNALPWAEVFIDGRQIGETPLGNIKVPIGEHEALFRNPQFGERRQTFLVTANEPARVAVDYKK